MSGKKNQWLNCFQLAKYLSLLLICLLLFGVKTASAAEKVSINGYGVGFLRHENELHFLVRESGRLICYQITPEHTLTRCTHGCAGKTFK